MENVLEPSSPPPYDVIVIGAGVSGLYATYRFLRDGLRVLTLDEAADVGGTWWWNKYPGARVDIPGGPYYCYTFSEELAREWRWEETHPDQAAVHGYLTHVADRFDLRPHIQLSTRVTSAWFDEARSVWVTETASGGRYESQFLVSAVGTLSAPHTPDIPGVKSFAGEIVHPGRWPQDHDVLLQGHRVGIIGTGSSGIQLVPQVAAMASHLTVFQRTPQYTVPARNKPVADDLHEAVRTRWPAIREKMLVSVGGMPNMPPPSMPALSVSAAEREAAFERAWEQGGTGIGRTFSDLLTDRAANDTLTDFIRRKIQQIVHDPQVAARLLPDYLYGTKRAVLDDGYYETFNRDNVSLVDLREEPIVEIYDKGVRTSRNTYPVDTLILATGYDAISGALRRLNPRGSAGVDLETVWADGVRTYLGVTVPGFPNMFVIHGPQTPSVLYNMPLGAERQVEWIVGCIDHMRSGGKVTVQASSQASDLWAAQVREIGSRTLFPETDSWYVGANIPGKRRELLVYPDGLGYYEALDAVTASAGYTGLEFADRDEATSDSRGPGSPAAVRLAHRPSDRQELGASLGTLERQPTGENTTHDVEPRGRSDRPG